MSKQMFKLSPVAAAVLGTALCSPAAAGEPIIYDNGVKLDWKATATYTLATRLKSPDPLLLDVDGNKNFDKGALTANRLGLLLEGKLSKDRSGFVFSASTFYDDVYHRGTDNKGPFLNTADAPGSFSDKARRYHGGYSRILDAYAFTSFGVGDGDATLRLGRHVVSWGEALFFPAISLAQGPVDGSKSDIPGTETKDLLLPEDQVSLIYRPMPNWTLMAHAQYGWHPTVSAAPGSFLNSGDSSGPGNSCLGPYLPNAEGGYTCSFGERQGDKKPGSTGQWGVGTRYRVTEETELGLYYLNYHDRIALPEIDVFGAGNALEGGTYRNRYFDDVKLIGASLSTTLGMATLAGEIAYKRGAPELVDAVVDPESGYGIPTPSRANVLQTSINSFINFGRSDLADGALLLAEVSYIDVRSVKKIKAPGVASLGPMADYFPASGKLSMSGHGLGISTSLYLNYDGVFRGWDLEIPISYSQQLSGRTLMGPVGGEGDRRFSIGATLTYNQNLSFELTYLDFLGKANTELKKERTLTDRDQLSLVVKYNF